MNSPIWYRARGTVFALIYASGFAIGYAIAGPSVPPAFRSPAAGAAALALMLCGIAMRVWGSSYLRAETVWSPDLRNDTFVVDGPFRFTRNPLYFGNLVMALGFGLLAPLPGWIFIVAASALFILALIRVEEFGMRFRYGAAFDAYVRSVPALFPRLMPAARRERLMPSLYQGITAEIFSAAFFLGMLAVLLTPAWGWWIFLLLLFAGNAVQRRMARA